MKIAGRADDGLPRSNSRKKEEGEEAPLCCRNFAVVRGEQRRRLISFQAPAPVLCVSPLCRRVRASGDGTFHFHSFIPPKWP